MSDKDPVLEQIDITTRDRMIDGDLSDLSYFDAAVQIAYDQDKIAWNRCLDEVIKLADEQKMWYENEGWTALNRFKQELEKKRR